jgi:hypothetical protein
LPRPPVVLATTRGATGRLSTTISVTGESNGLVEVRIGDAKNATVQGAGSSGQNDFTIPLSNQPKSVVLLVTRRQAGPVHVPMVVIDRCGEWKTFVGGGPSAF